jgi:hypothetical protein
MSALNNISDSHTDYAQRMLSWSKIRDCLEGEDRVKDQGKAYLPQPSGMDLNAYKAYKTRSSFYAVTERTLRGLSGLVFRNDPIFNCPEKLEPMRENMASDGYSFPVLCQEVIDEVLSIGRYGILVDFPSGAAVTDLPHLVTYRAEDIINWSQRFIAGKKVLTRIVLRDDIDNTNGNDAVRYLELFLDDAGEYVSRVWEGNFVAAQGVKPTSLTFAVTDERKPTVGGKPMKMLPFVFINPYDLKPDVEKPPFLDLVNMNLAHFRNSADYEHSLFLTAQPTPWVAGNLDAATRPKSIGSGTIWYLPESTTVGMLEFQGAGIEAQRSAMLDKEDRMAALGARMIKDGSKSAETAETTRLRGRSEMSLLTSVVNMVSAGLTSVLKMAAEFVGVDPSEVEVYVNCDFIETRLSPQELSELIKAWQSGAISRRTLHENLQRGEIVPGDRKEEDEKDLIDQEAMDLEKAVATVQRALQPPGQDQVPPQPEDSV